MISLTIASSGMLFISSSVILPPSGDWIAISGFGGSIWGFCGFSPIPPLTVFNSALRRSISTYFQVPRLALSLKTQPAFHPSVSDAQ
jgi:hypothetical protein